MSKPGRNDSCPCGSGKKYKRCCIDKKPRERSVMIGSSEPLRGVYYDKEKMEFTGITHDNRLIKPVVTYSQTHYESESGKERVITRIHDKVVDGEPDILRHLSSTFDVIVAMDTNTKEIAGERISACGIVHCILQRLPDAEREGYYASFPWQNTLLFRNSSVVPDLAMLPNKRKGLTAGFEFYQWPTRADSASLPLSVAKLAGL